jgi:hypothetical protein
VSLPTDCAVRTKRCVKTRSRSALARTVGPTRFLDDASLVAPACKPGRTLSSPPVNRSGDPAQIVSNLVAAYLLCLWRAIEYALAPLLKMSALASWSISEAQSPENVP